MSPTMQKKLARNIEYHQAVADHYTEQVTAATTPVEGQPAGEADPTHQALADMHSEVAKQLQDVLNANATPTTVLSMPLTRNASSDLRPSSGRFH